MSKEGKVILLSVVVFTIVVWFICCTAKGYLAIQDAADVAYAGNITTFEIEETEDSHRYTYIYSKNANVTPPVCHLKEVTNTGEPDRLTVVPCKYLNFGDKL
jgi:mannose-1-phosphate guanylyltransferase